MLITIPRCLRPLLPPLTVALLFSVFINLLALSYIFYLRLVFEKVMPNRSTETLALLTLLVVTLYIISGILTALRSKLLVRMGIHFEQLVTGHIFGQMLGESVAAGAPRNRQGLTDVSNIRQFLSGAGITAVFDAPWVVVYLAVIFLFHPLLGLIACIGAVLLVVLMIIQQLTTRHLTYERLNAAQATEQFLSSSLRNAQTLYAMGMLAALSQRWRGFNRIEVDKEDQLAAHNALFQGLSKGLLLATVLAVITAGAYLILMDKITLGTMIAAAMFMGRGLAPLLMLGSNWKNLQEARLAYARIKPLLMDTQPTTPIMTIPSHSTLHSEPLALDFDQRPILRCPGFDVLPGSLLAVVGSNGSGKSTLARILLGLWSADQGQVRLGATPLTDFDSEQLGRQMGYLPQEVALFTASVAENIARLGSVDSPTVVAAAQSAGVHELILSLPQGYDTPLGSGGINLSGGQKQRIALARALYGEPLLIILDEPDSHLDQPSRNLLKKILGDLKQRGACIVVISHSSELTADADQLLNLDTVHLEQRGGLLS